MFAGHQYEQQQKPLDGGMCTMSWTKFTFAISSRDEFLVLTYYTYLFDSETGNSLIREV